MLVGGIVPNPESVFFKLGRWHSFDDAELELVLLAMLDRVELIDRVWYVFGGKGGGLSPSALLDIESLRVELFE